MSPSLFPSPVEPLPQKFFSLIVDADKILDDPKFNPRRDFGEEDGSFAALVQSIRERGMIQPPRLVPAAVPPGYSIDTDDGKVDIFEEMTWHIVSGHRRIAAARDLGWKQIECYCLSFEYESDVTAYTEGERLIDALVENLQRKELNCIEVAEGIARLERMGHTQEQIATLIGRSQGRVSRLVRLLDLPHGVRTHLRLGSLSRTAGEELIPLIGSGLLPGEIDALAEKAVEAGLSAVALANVVRQRLEALQPKQAELFGANNEHNPQTSNNSARSAASEASPVASEATDSSAQKLNAPPKETNGLTRKESDAQFAAAMAPDPDVTPLSSLPAVQAPTPALVGEASANEALVVSTHTMEKILRLTAWWNYNEPSNQLTPAMYAESVFERVYEQVAANEAARRYMEDTSDPDCNGKDFQVSTSGDAFLEAVWRTLANHGQEKLLLGFRLPTTRGTARRFSEMLGEALGESGYWSSPGTGWVCGRNTGGRNPSVELEYNHGDGFANTIVTYKNGDLLTVAEKAIAWKHTQVAALATATRAQEGALQREKELADQAAAEERRKAKAEAHAARVEESKRRAQERKAQETHPENELPTTGNAEDFEDENDPRIELSPLWDPFIVKKAQSIDATIDDMVGRLV